MKSSASIQPLPAFTTRSLRTAAYLSASGFPAEIRALDGKQGLFIFASTAELLSAIELLERDQARVSPRALERARAELRSDLGELRRVPWTPSLGVLTEWEVQHGTTTAV